MNMSKQKPVSTRLSLQELAKARDALIASGISVDQLDTVSQILRLSVYSTIIKHTDVNLIPSEESLEVLNHTFSRK